MNPERLVAMANDIADNLCAGPDRGAAIEAMVVHLQRFWEPRMRLDIVGHLRQHDGLGLNAFARDALAELARRLDEPAPPTRRGASDAG